MATTPEFSYALSEESAVHHLINASISDSADLLNWSMPVPRMSAYWWKLTTQ